MTIKSTPADPNGRLVAGTSAELAFTDLLANGQAVGRSAGMVVFCFGPLPGERARVRITSVKPKYAVAEVVDLIEQSPERATPFCPVFGTCGGCQVQHLAYSAQLSWKARLVHNALARIGGFQSIEVSRPIGMDEPRAYRNKMSLVVGDGDLGFYKQRSHDVVRIQGCPIVMPQLDDHIGRLQTAAKGPQLRGAFAATRHIVERTASQSGQSVVTFTTERPSRELADAGAALLDLLPGAVGVTNSFEPSSANAIIGREQRLLAGRPFIEEHIGGLRYRVSAASFFQVNVEIVGRIFEFMRPRLTAVVNVVDLYCGAGAFSLFFAKAGCAVLGVDESPHAIAEAHDNAQLNDLAPRATFVAGRVEDLVRTARVREALAQAHMVFLDPPRKGSDEATLGALCGAAVPSIWYLSCDPATLARDLKFLAANGYGIELVQPFDMFPQTGHVETLVIARRHQRMDV